MDCWLVGCSAGWLAGWVAELLGLLGLHSCWKECLNSWLCWKVACFNVLRHARRSGGVGGFLGHTQTETHPGMLNIGKRHRTSQETNMSRKLLGSKDYLGILKIGVGVGMLGGVGDSLIRKFNKFFLGFSLFPISCFPVSFVYVFVLCSLFYSFPQHVDT